MGFDWNTWLMVFCTSLASALCAAWLIVQGSRNPKKKRYDVFEVVTGDVIFIFDGEVLVDATPAARALIAESPVRGGAWLRLLAKLGPKFPDIEERILSLGRNGTFLLPSRESFMSPQLLKGEMVGGLIRLSLIFPETKLEPNAANVAGIRSATQEAAELRKVVEGAPMMIWMEDEAGNVIWANGSYVDASVELLPKGQMMSWPFPRVFETAIFEQSHKPRQKALLPNGEVHWFELHCLQEGDVKMVYAVNCDATIAAETSLQEFMQTLTKTFAHLPIGLAIFDQNRLLQLFNPALLDLTGLSPDFLITRPTMMSFLDALRENAVIPEPKDYRSWRNSMLDLEKAASVDVFEDVWSLPSGQTYQVIGRPHPNGAIALMFKDISNELSRTLRYRADLEIGQAALDVLDDGVAVFSQTGALVMTNLAYCRIWGHDPAEMLSDASFRTLSPWWREHSAPSLMWDDAENFVSQIGDRDPWMGDVRLKDGRVVECRFLSISSGATVISFRASSKEGDHLRFIRSHSRAFA